MVGNVPIKGGYHEQGGFRYPQSILLIVNPKPQLAVNAATFGMPP